MDRIINSLCVARQLELTVSFVQGRVTCQGLGRCWPWSPGLPKGGGCGSGQLSAGVWGGDLSSKQEQKVRGWPQPRLQFLHQCQPALPRTTATRPCPFPSCRPPTCYRQEPILSLQSEFAAHQLLESSRFGSAGVAMTEQERWQGRMGSSCSATVFVQVGTEKHEGASLLHCYLATITKSDSTVCLAYSALNRSMFACR